MAHNPDNASTSPASGGLREELRRQRKAYSSPFNTLRRYWASYGGKDALFRSPFFHTALILSIPGALWSASGDWINKVNDILPSTLGLTLAGYAILLAVGAGDFQTRLAKAGGAENSVLGNMNTSYLHFVMVQVTALIAALISEPILTPLRAFADGFTEQWKAMSRIAFNYFGWILLFYSITCAIAATFRLYRLVQWFIKDQNETPPKPTAG